jgi:hypothetical protein
MLGRGSLQITLNSAHLLLPHHAVASSKGNAPAWAGAAARYRTRPPSRGIGRSAPSGNAGGDSGIHDYPQAVLHPMRGRDHRAAPKGLRRAVRTRAAPYTSPSLTLVCLLQADVRPSAFHASRAFQDPAPKDQSTKEPGQGLRDRTVRLPYLLIPNSCRDPPN